MVAPTRGLPDDEEYERLLRLRAERIHSLDRDAEGPSPTRNACEGSESLNKQNPRRELPANYPPPQRLNASPHCELRVVRTCHRGGLQTWRVDREFRSDAHRVACGRCAPLAVCGREVKLIAPRPERRSADRPFLGVQCDTGGQCSGRHRPRVGPASTGGRKALREANPDFACLPLLRAERRLHTDGLSHDERVLLGGNWIPVL